MRRRQHHFSIGAVSVSLRSDCRSFTDEYLSLYAPYRRDSADSDTIDVEIKARHTFPWCRGPYMIQGDGVEGFEVPRRHDVLPHLEWFINWQIIRRRDEYLQLHASSLEIDGDALILPGDPGSGKSTLAAGLLAGGWSYLCDEFALIDPETLMIQPYPRALCMKEASFAVVDRLGLPLVRKTPYRKAAKGRVAFLNPLDVRGNVVGKASRVRWVIFPRYVADAAPRLEPMARSQAAYELARQCFNFQAYEAGAVDVLAELTRGAECYQLTTGAIDATCDLVQRLVGGGKDASATRIDHP